MAAAPFSRTSVRDFKLQHQVTLLFGDASQRQLCSRWASMFSYARAQPPAGPPVWSGLAGGFFASLPPRVLYEFESKGAPSGSNAYRDPS